MEDKDRKNVTVVEAAEYLGLSRTTVQDMVDRGVLKAIRINGDLLSARTGKEPPGTAAGEAGRGAVVGDRRR